MTITEFLTARYDEDEAIARACAEVYPSPWDVTDRGHMAAVRADGPSFRVVSELEQDPSIDGWLSDRLDHIARHDPARVVADIAAKRAIVALYESSGLRIAMGQVVRLLAQPYAEHAQFQEEWHA